MGWRSSLVGWRPSLAGWRPWEAIVSRLDLGEDLALGTISSAAHAGHSIPQTRSSTSSPKGAVRPICDTPNLKNISDTPFENVPRPS